MNAARPRRILIGKVGLDGHDRGAKFIVRALRNAGYEVIYTGIRRTPEQIVQAAVQEDADAIGLSVLSGSHMTLCRRVLELLDEQDAGDIALFAGGTIPSDDAETLEAAGVAAIFPPGTSDDTILETVDRLLTQRHESA